MNVVKYTTVCRHIKKYAVYQLLHLILYYVFETITVHAYTFSKINKRLKTFF